MKMPMNGQTPAAKYTVRSATTGPPLGPAGGAAGQQEEERDEQEQAQSEDGRAGTGGHASVTLLRVASSRQVAGAGGAAADGRHHFNHSIGGRLRAEEESARNS